MYVIFSSDIIDKIVRYNISEVNFIGKCKEMIS